jgi:hypothetical protein
MSAFLTSNFCTNFLTKRSLDNMMEEENIGTYMKYKWIVVYNICDHTPAGV